MDAEREKMMADLQREFGHRPNEDEGEKWTVYRNRHLVVIHPERRPRIYDSGCGGTYYEIEPHF